MKKVLIIAIATIFVGLLTACSQTDETNSEDKTETEVPVETAQAEKGDLIIKKSIYGRTAPQSSIPIMVQAPGEITELKVENGDTIEKGDYIATVGGRNIYAPTSGEIAKLTAEEKSIASNSEPLAVIIDLDPIKVQFSVTADELDFLEKGDKYKIIIDGSKLEAEITSIGTMPNETGLFPVEAEIANDEETILPGIVAKLHVPVKKAEDSILVPTESIVQQNGETFIFVVKDHKAKKINVTVKETQSEQSAIDGDISKGDQVITSGQLTLTDGMKVDIVKAGNAS